MSSRSNFRKKDRMDTQISSDHEGKKTFRCAICEKSFANVTKLNEHISAIHKEKKPYKCDICDYICSQKDHMKRCSLKKT